MLRNKKTWFNIGMFLMFVAVLAIDQFTKEYFRTNFYVGQSIPIIEDVLHFSYVQNYGAAFGIMQNHRWVFLIITGVFIIAAAVALFINKIQQPLHVFVTVLIISGGIGNMIDRLFFHYVTDFIDVKIINYPVFNIADCAVCIGCAIVFVSLIVEIIQDARKKKSLTDVGENSVCDENETVTENSHEAD